MCLFMLLRQANVLPQIGHVYGLDFLIIGTWGWYDKYYNHSNRYLCRTVKHSSLQLNFKIYLKNMP
jgi:hypothetical protein